MERQMLTVEKMEYPKRWLEEAITEGAPFGREFYYRVLVNETSETLCNFDFIPEIGWTVHDLSLNDGMSLKLLKATSDALQKVISDDALEQMVKLNQEMSLY